MKSVDFIELCTPYHGACSPGYDDDDDEEEETPDTLSFSELDDDMYYDGHLNPPCYQPSPGSLTSSRTTSYSSIITELRETCSSYLADGNESEVSPAVSPLNPQSNILRSYRVPNNRNMLSDDGYYDHIFPKLNLSLSSFVSDKAVSQTKGRHISDKLQYSDNHCIGPSKRRNSLNSCLQSKSCVYNQPPLLRASSLAAFPSTRGQTLTNSTSCSSLKRPRLTSSSSTQDLGRSVKCIREKLSFFDKELSSRQSTQYLQDDPQYEKVSSYSCNNKKNPGCYDNKNPGWESTDDGLGSYVSSCEPDYEEFQDHDLCSLDSGIPAASEDRTLIPPYTALSSITSSASPYVPGHTTAPAPGAYGTYLSVPSPRFSCTTPTSPLSSSSISPATLTSLQDTQDTSNQQYGTIGRREKRRRGEFQESIGGSATTGGHRQLHPSDTATTCTLKRANTVCGSDVHNYLRNKCKRESLMSQGSEMSLKRHSKSTFDSGFESGLSDILDEILGATAYDTVFEDPAYSKSKWQNFKEKLSDTFLKNNRKVDSDNISEMSDIKTTKWNKFQKFVRVKLAKVSHQDLDMGGFEDSHWRSLEPRQFHRGTRRTQSMVKWRSSSQR